MDTPSYKVNLDTEVQYLKGVGPKRGKVLRSFGINNIKDLLKNYPRKYLDRTNIKKISTIKIGENVVIIGTVASFGIKPLKRGKYFQVQLKDDTGEILGIWFNGLSWIMDKFNIGDVLAIYGKVEFYRGYRIIHPEFDLLDTSNNFLNTGKIIPIYSSNTQLKQLSLDSRGIRKLIINSFNSIHSVEDHFDQKFIRNEALMSLNDAMRQMHNPDSNEALSKALYRIKFDEYFFLQLVLALNKYKIDNSDGEKINQRGPYVREIYENLGFELTNAQINVLREIRKDLSLSKPMNRLIQGDVGCGKTIVAILTSAIVVANGSQVAIMAPTEILAEQHYDSFNEYYKRIDISCELLISNIDEKKKQNIYERLEKGEINIIIGTHALIQEKVKFFNLGLAVIDEQHRFGVEQRKNLIIKGKQVNILAMTATPIPRTLSFAIHGDMDLSWIDEQPKNRIPIKTKIINESNIDVVYKKMKHEMDKGRFCFIVYPIIQESEKIDAADAESAYEKFSKDIFKKYKIGFLHGKLKKDEKNTLINKVNNKEIQCLVSTTVVEVGINNPNATIMVIQNSERFGLTQLHQLRGRVGRGKYQSYCYLIQRKKTDVSFKRLSILEKNLNGFDIADEDLKLRGPGEFCGTKQHGYMSNKLLDIVNDMKIIRHAKILAFNIVNSDPELVKNIKLKHKLLNDYSNILEFVNIG